MSEITYTRGEDGIFYPDLVLNENEADNLPLSKYGSLAKKYLQDSNPVKYQSLTLDGELMAYLHSIDKAAIERHMTIKAQLEKTTPKPPQGDTLAVIQYHRKIQDTAEEIVLAELIYQE